MEVKQEQLVARLRHNNPTLTVTELHIHRVDHSKKNLVIEYLKSLRLNHTVESTPELETVVSVDISSRIEQDDIFKKLLAFIRDIGIGDVSITSEPFDEQQPEIESIDCIPAMESCTKNYVPLNNEDTEDLISRDKSESEFELILSRPRGRFSRDSSRLRDDQSSRDVIGSILRISEGRSHSSDWSLYQCPDRSQERTLRNPKQRINTLWSRAKRLFKRKRNPTKQSVGKCQAIVSNYSNLEEARNSNEKRKSNVFSLIHDMNAKTDPEQVSINTLQKRLEKVSHDVFCMKNKCPGMNTDGPSLDAYTQTHKTVKEAELKSTNTQTASRMYSSTDSRNGKYYTTNNLELHSNEQSLSETSVISDSTDSEDQMMKGVRVARHPRGMVTNYIPLYPNMKPVICGMKPVGAPFFFRRVISGKTNSHSTTTSCLTTTTSASFKSAHSILTFSSLSYPMTDQGQNTENSCISLENVIYTRSEDQYSCGIVSTKSKTPFERERFMNTQTVNPVLKATEINTSGVFKLPKVTQTKPRKRRKTLPVVQKIPSVGTQTSVCSSSTSCTNLLRMKSCGTKTENDVVRVDKENSCHLLTKKNTENKETNSETLMLKCESCQGLLDKQAKKKRKSSGRQRGDRAVKRGLGWGEYPDGNFGFGQCYAPGKVFPVISLATGLSVGNPFSIPVPHAKGENHRNTCPVICNMFGSKKRALMEELNKQKMELMQMRMVLVAINEELLAECTDTSSDENQPSSEDTYHSFDSQVSPKQNKKVTFRNPLVNERTMNYAKHY